MHQSEPPDAGSREGVRHFVGTERHCTMPEER